MKKILSFAILMMLLASTGKAQEKLISDTIVVPPVFSGYIGYRISYSGKLSHEQKHWLPDSMLVIVRHPVIRIRFFGGMAPQLLNDIYWNFEDGNYLLVDHAHQVAYVPPSAAVQAPARAGRHDGKENILGFPCLSFTVETPAEKLRVWASDSTFFPINFQDSVPQMRPIFFQANLASIPLKTERNRAGITTTTLATQLVRANLPEEEIHVPTGYARDSFEGRMTRHPWIGKE